MGIYNVTAWHEGIIKYICILGFSTYLCLRIEGSMSSILTSIVPPVLSWDWCLSNGMFAGYSHLDKWTWIPHCFRQMQSHSWNNECIYACDRTVLCCEKKKHKIYIDESKIICTIGTCFAVGYTAGWAWQNTHGLLLSYHCGASVTLIVHFCLSFLP